MSLSEPTRRRLPRIKKGLINGLTIGQIADICKVTEKTIDRDLNKFRASPLFEEWLREEWQRLHYIIINENPVEAYRQLTRLLGQTFTRKIEALSIQKIEQHVTIDVSENEDEILSKAARILTRKRKSQSIH